MEMMRIKFLIFIITFFSTNGFAQVAPVKKVVPLPPKKSGAQKPVASQKKVIANKAAPLKQQAPSTKMLPLKQTARMPAQSSTAAAKPVAASAMPMRATPTPVSAAVRPPTPAAAIAPVIQATPATSLSTRALCTSKSAEKGIQVESALYWKLLAKQTVNVYLADLEKCYKIGQSVDIFEIKPPDKVVYWMFMRGTGVVKNMNTISYSDVRRFENGKMIEQDIKKIGARITAISGKTGQDLEKAPVLMITIAPSVLESRLRNYGSPKKHPVALTLDRKEFADAVKAGTAFDIRPQGLRDKSPIKKANAIKVAKIEEISKKILSPTEMAAVGAVVSESGLPKKNQPINIISGCQGEFSAYNTLTLLASMGYKNLSWFPGGVADFNKGAPCETPVSSPVASVIDAAKVKSYAGSTTTTLLDVRPGAPATIFGAETVPFIQKENDLGLPKLRKDITVETLTREGEVFGLPLKKYPSNQTFVLFGVNNYDWRPYKAAMILNSMGYKNIFWFRDGFDDWAQKVLASPAEYKLNKKVTNKDLY